MASIFSTLCSTCVKKPPPSFCYPLPSTLRQVKGLISLDIEVAGGLGVHPRGRLLRSSLLTFGLLPVLSKEGDGGSEILRYPSPLNVTYAPPLFLQNFNGPFFRTLSDKHDILRLRPDGTNGF